MDVEGECDQKSRENGADRGHQGDHLGAHLAGELDVALDELGGRHCRHPINLFLDAPGKLHRIHPGSGANEHVAVVAGQGEQVREVTSMNEGDRVRNREGASR